MNIEKITPENYKVPKGEERSYHCIIECVQYDSKTGKKISVPRIQKFGRKMFESHVYSSLKKQGYNIIILHNPTEWLKEQAEIAKQKAEEAAAKKAEEEKALAEAKKAEEAAAKKAEEEKALAEAKKAEEEKKFKEAVAAEVARQMAAIQKGDNDAPAPQSEEQKGDGKQSKEQSAPKNKGGRPRKNQ